MTIPTWLTPTSVIAAIALTFTVTTWSIKRADEIKEKKKRAVLAVTTSSEGVLEFYPIGGHGDPRAPTMFWIYVENKGDAKAEHVVVTFELPPWVHPGTPREFGYPKTNQDGTTEWTQIERDDSEDIKFKIGGTRKGGSHSAEIVLPRPIYPEQKQQIGLVIVDARAGEHRFDWSIESSAGHFASDDATAVYIKINATAVGHDDIPFAELREPDGRRCSACEEARSRFTGLGTVGDGGSGT
ncbi:MAG TPA: hypothetical protein VFB22_05865 [Candidatus Baltobacteraceae bacterium]|nr:hypothetical protein [Candidatus Baltobacteraceae bacterium]